ncbi:MAG: Maf family nucleotide pyrophosphatase [Candidatus Accumulibacter sp.]|jgi:septum formation protein|nr:Maf family nucleotide pyrophosphatase [Accumulibacter sp.]
MTAYRLVLASTSPFRRQLLDRLKIPFEVADPRIDERPKPNEAPERIALRLSEEKARSVAGNYLDALIVGSDQVVCLDGEIFGKPLTHGNAVRQLQRMRGRIVRFHTGICLLNAKSGAARIRNVSTRVGFRNLSDEEIEDYLQKEQPYHCAGSAKSEELGIALVSKIESDDPTALIGLPLITLNEFLRDEGINPLSDFPRTCGKMPDIFEFSP